MKKRRGEKREFCPCTLEKFFIVSFSLKKRMKVWYKVDFNPLKTKWISNLMDILSNYIIIFT